MMNNLLCFVQMCKFFTHYGVCTILVLYMISILDFSEKGAFMVNGCFLGLFDLLCIVGGYCADKYIGLGRALVFGSALLSFGYLSLLFEGGLFVALGLVVLGNSFFSPSITALLGSAYEGDDLQREKAFTIFYMMQNAGSFLSTILCGFLALYWGFKAAFFVASSGILLGTALAIRYCRKNQTGGMIYHQVRGSIKEYLPKLSVLLGSLILFYAASGQIGSSFIVLTEKIADRNFFGIVMPSSLVTVMNPLMIMAFGSIVANFRFGLAFPLIVTGGVFVLLSTACSSLSFFMMIGIVGLISLAELMVGPPVMSAVSALAGKANAGFMMGVVSVAFSLSSFLSGLLGTLVASDGSVPSAQVYQTGFMAMAGLCICGGLVIAIITRLGRYEKKYSLR
jgi:proton-dependent oligopeptide transporter, POT family